MAYRGRKREEAVERMRTAIQNVEENLGFEKIIKDWKNTPQVFLLGVIDEREKFNIETLSLKCLEVAKDYQKIVDVDTRSEFQEIVKYLVPAILDAYYLIPYSNRFVSESKDRLSAYLETKKKLEGIEDYVSKIDLSEVGIRISEIEQNSKFLRSKFPEIDENLKI